MHINDILKQAQLQKDFVGTDNTGTTFCDFTKSIAVTDFSGTRDSSYLVFADSTPRQKQNRPLKSDSAAGIIAKHLITGKGLTIQTVRSILASNNIVSNDEGRRLREARSWLERQGLSIGVSDYYKRDKPVCKVWFVHPNKELQQAALAKLKGTK